MKHFKKFKELRDICMFAALLVAIYVLLIAFMWGTDMVE